MHEITVERTFAAAHAIRLYDGSLEPVHGHNWLVQVTVQTRQLDRIELVMDFHQLERLVEEQLAKVNNRHLNDVEPFSQGCANPTAERVAQWLGEQIAPSLPARVRLASVRVGEAPGCTATYRPDEGPAQA